MCQYVACSFNRQHNAERTGPPAHIRVTRSFEQAHAGSRKRRNNHYGTSDAGVGTACVPTRERRLGRRRAAAAGARPGRDSRLEAGSRVPDSETAQGDSVGVTSHHSVRPDRSCPSFEVCARFFWPDTRREWLARYPRSSWPWM